MTSQTGKTVLVVGSGGREHALAWKLSRSPQVSEVIVAPGNAGMPKAWKRWGFQASGGTQEFQRLAAEAIQAKIDLTIIGPDNPLAEGIVDVFESRGLLCFGPRAGAAQIEASKVFAKEVMDGAGVPTARFENFSSLEAALAFLEKGIPAEWNAGGCVVKADGLALGKGVHVCGGEDEAKVACQALFPVSGRLLIEERLQGEEISWMALCDGESCALLEPARDYKRLKDGDEGPNTGGMGAFSPVPGVPDSWSQRMRDEVFLPVLKQMKKLGHPFQGVLYAGLMVDLENDQFWLLEFNARFGDPEAQVLLPRIERDLYPFLEQCARGQLEEGMDQIPFTQESAVVIVGAAEGYPESPRKGDRIEGQGREASLGVELGADPFYFFAGVSETDSQNLVTAGGRVFGAAARAPSLRIARSLAYERLKDLSFEGMQFRKDIADE